MIALLNGGWRRRTRDVRLPCVCIWRCAGGVPLSLEIFQGDARSIPHPERCSIGTMLRTWEVCGACTRPQRRRRRSLLWRPLQ